MNGRMLIFIPFFAVCFLAGPAGTLAETVQGTVKAVDRDAKNVSIETEWGPETVHYSEATEWPASVTDLDEMTGRTVQVNLDHQTGEVLTVEMIE